MKSIKNLAASLALVAFVFTGCVKELPSGEDQSKPAPSDLSYDCEESVTDAIPLCWDAAQLIAQGATAFSIDAVDSPSDPVDTYKSSMQTIKASAIGEDGIGRTSFTKGISEFTEKYVRIRAHYGAVFSPWVFASDGNGNPAVLIAGHGIKDLDKPVVGKVDLTECPVDSSFFSIKVDLTPAASANRIILILMDFAAQKPLETFNLDPASGSFEHTFEGLTAGKLYQVKSVAEYDIAGKPTHVSEWSFAEGEVLNDEGETVISNVIQCGKGFAFINGVPPTVKCVEQRSGQLVFQWTEFGFENIENDAKIPVKIALYKDKNCKQLVYGWTVPSFTIADKQPGIVFSNLEPGTKYWCTCQDTESGLISDAVEAQTAAFDIVTVGDLKVAIGAFALAENFGELYYGGYCTNWSPSPKNASNGLPHPTPGQWDGADLDSGDSNHGFFNTLGKSGAVQNSRFKDWAVVHGLKDGTGAEVPGDACIRTGMFQMGASSGIPIVFTPELTNLSSLATVSVTFTISSMWEKGTMKEAGSSDFTNIGIYTATGGQADQSKSASYGTLTGANINQVAVIDRPSTTVKTPTWEDQTVTIQNIAPGTRIGIGAIRPDGKTGNQRFLLSCVTVKVVSYGTVSLTTPDLVSKEIGKNKANFVFKEQESAQSYQLGYKLYGEPDYKYIENTKPEFEITGLSPNTTYLIRVVSKAGDAESETPFYLEFTTESVDFNYPLDIQTQEDFMNWIQYGAEFTNAGDVINLGCDLDLADLKAGNRPMIAEFGGTLNGNNHTIKNFNGASGFIGKLSGSVKDLTIDSSCSFSTSGETLTFGIIANESTATSTISGITNKAAVSYSAADVTESLCYGAIVGLSYGAISDCTNEGAVTVTSQSRVMGTAIGGIAGYQAAALTNCTNRGTVTLNALYCNGKSTIGKTADVSTNAGGIAGLGHTGFSANNCNNYGKINVNLTAINKAAEAKIARTCYGGICGGPAGNITNCNNYADINIKSITENRAAWDATHIVCAGGISGGDAFAANQNETNIRNCTNEGAINVDFDSYSSNSAIGGIVGWPGVESDAQTVEIDGCTNKGAVTITGGGFGRIGGVCGGAGNVINCKNYATVLFKANSTGKAGSCVGGINGYSSYDRKFTGNENFGDVINEDKTAYTGGLIGGWANQPMDQGANCKVKCKVTAVDGGATSGMIIGRINGTKHKKTFGKDGAVKVAGTISIDGTETTITDKNYGTYLCGTHDYNKSCAFTAEYGE